MRADDSVVNAESPYVKIKGYAGMTEKQAQKTFEKYNPASKAVRCPNGRAPVRKLLDIYARAAINLYGIISRKELADIFNSQNDDRTSADEVFSLLLPLVIKSKRPRYCFYKDYIVHYWAFDDFDYADYWLWEQSDKPRFIPEKEEFLKFENQYYESESQEAYWEKLWTFIVKEWSGNIERYRFFNEIKELSAYNFELREISDLIDEYGLIFKNEKSTQNFFNLLMNARNNTRLWANKGYSPKELVAIMEKERPKEAPVEMVIHQNKKVGPNEPCPCGSGKKYKKCCRLTEESGTARLSRSECGLFYVTWYRLLDYINRKLDVVDYKFSLKYPDFHDETLLYKIRERLWEEPKLISEFIDENSGKLSDEEAGLLRSWEKHHIKQMFFVVDYKPEYAVLLGNDGKKRDVLYGVKGMTSSIADTMRRELPIQLETVLLPFKDIIIYDSFMSSMPVSFAAGAKRAFGEMYEAALAHGIITRLG
jgi:hypothetical protein